jgi:hypothetical protein
MVLRPRQNRYTHLSLISTTLLSSASWVRSSPNLEPLSFKEAYQLMCWYNAMQFEIASLHVNGT